MRIYVFKSESRADLRAFAGDLRGSRLPEKFGPWTATGVIAADRPAPHNFSRADIEEALEGPGFQLWRVRSKGAATG
jgi:hypothetical protein